MARFRNPRYAPESLERRLNPSVSLTTTVEVASYNDTAPPPVAPSPPPTPDTPVPASPITDGPNGPAT